MTGNHSPTFGVHTSIAGGLQNAVARAVEKGCDALQIFARNPRGWMERPLEVGEIHTFRDARERAGLFPLAIHAVYLINLAAQDAVILERSRTAFRQELIRGLEIGADYLVVHPGNPKTASADAGVYTAIESIREATQGLNLQGAAATKSRAGKPNGLTILIENTAGQGSSIGCSFEQVADIVAALNDEVPIGVCLDTAHTLASGYDLSTATGFQKTVRQIQRSFTFEKLRLIHCNDSKTPLNSRVDRHQHIGLGHIGLEGFRRIIENANFRRLPFVLETPVDATRNDEGNLAVLRELSKSDGKRRSKDQIEESL
jgi:deoxyribonuclease-4